MTANLITYQTISVSILFLMGFGIMSCASAASEVVEGSESTQVVLDTAAILSSAEAYLDRAPKTITSFPIERSAGGLHDYYSEGRYWWPDPENPDGPYIRKDGQTNPDLFTDHREALNDLADGVSALTFAFLKTSDQKYADKAKAYLLAWFVNPSTHMNPSLNYGQAIKGITEGRGIGIIDTRCLIYVARAVELLAAKEVFSKEEEAGLRAWFHAYSDWLVTSQFGIDERNNDNNHSSWWGAQLTAFARVADRSDLLDTAKIQYCWQLEIQMDARGIFPEEAGRTRPFHYIKYNLDAFAVLAMLLSEKGIDVWSYKTPNGDFQKSADWYLSFIRNLDKWPYTSELEPNLSYQPAEYLLLLHQQFSKSNKGEAYAKTFVAALAHHEMKAPQRMALLTWPID